MSAALASAVSPAAGSPVDFAALPRVREIEGVDPAQLPDAPFLAGDEPLILRGLVAHWPEVSMTSTALLAGLGEAASEAPVTFYTAPPEAAGRVFYNEALDGFNFERRSGRLRDCCAWLDANAGRADAGTLYVGSTAVDGWLPGFRDAHDLAPARDEVLCSLWLGNRTRIAAHYDFPRNLACVVAGQRRFTVFPPDSVLDLHIGPLEFTPSGQPISLVDFHAVDARRFPRFSRALERARVAELAPGDAIYLPGMWWHHVEALGDVNMLINYWWRDSALYLGSPQMALLHAALAIGQLGEAERAPWEALFRDLVFRRSPTDWEHLGEARGVLGTCDEGGAAALRRLIVKQLQA